MVFLHLFNLHNCIVQIVSPAAEKKAGRGTVSIEERSYWSSDHEKQL